MPRLVLNRPIVVVMRESSHGAFCAVLSGLEGAEHGAQSVIQDCGCGRGSGVYIEFTL